jgi:hypothetical protein
MPRTTRVSRRRRTATTKKSKTRKVADKWTITNLAISINDAEKTLQFIEKEKNDYKNANYLFREDPKVAFSFLKDITIHPTGFFLHIDSITMSCGEYVMSFDTLGHMWSLKTNHKKHQFNLQEFKNDRVEVNGFRSVANLLNFYNLPPLTKGNIRLSETVSMPAAVDMLTSYAESNDIHSSGYLNDNLKENYYREGKFNSSYFLFYFPNRLGLTQFNIGLGTRTAIEQAFSAFSLYEFDEFLLKYHVQHFTHRLPDEQGNESVYERVSADRITPTKYYNESHWNKK